MCRMSFLNTSACDEDMHVMASFRQVRDNRRHGFLVGEVGCDNGGLPTESFNLIVRFLVAFVSLGAVVYQLRVLPRHLHDAGFFPLMDWHAIPELE